MKIVLSGSIAFDYLMSFPGLFSDHFMPDKLDRISVSFLVDSLKKQRGGCAANIAYSLALLGETPLLLGAVGEDFTEYRESLEKSGVDVSGATEFSKTYTASFFANTDQSGNQISSFYTGAMQYANELSIRDWVSDPKETLVVVSPNDPAAMQKHVSECQDLEVPYIYDPSQQIVRLEGQTLKECAKGAKILIFNDYELELFKKKTGLTETELLGLAETVIVTLGDQGAVIHTQEEQIEIPVAKPDRINDPTGVGDAFRAGLIKGLKMNLPWADTGRIASLAAAYVLETDGPQSHQYTWEQFKERYQSVFNGYRL